MWVSGSGKNTVIDFLGLRKDPRFEFVRSYTTRPMREDDVEWAVYHFITKEQFDKMIEQWELLEYIHVHGLKRYGTKISSVLEVLDRWHIALKELEVLGLIKIQEREKLFQYYSIFLDIDEQTIRQRIWSRSKLSEEEIAARVSSSEHEKALAKEHCYIVIDASRTIELVAKDFMAFIESKIN